MVDFPIHFDFGGETGHWIHFNSEARDSMLFALYEGCPRSAERIQNAHVPVYAPSGQVLPDKVWRKRKNESIPIVSSTIITLDLIVFTFGYENLLLCRSHREENLIHTGRRKYVEVGFQ